jgi:hypothetical protein
VAFGLSVVVSAWVGTATNATGADDQRRPTFATDISPILIEHCAPCHRPDQAAPFSLLSLDEVRARGIEIVHATQSRAMPPWSAVQGPGFPALVDDRRLTDRQITAIKTWVANGMPGGDLRKAPIPPPAPPTWPLGLPDLTIALPRTVGREAGSPDVARNIVIPVGFPTDLWISAIDYQPGASRVLRHARFFAAPPDLVVGEADALPGVGGLLGSGSLENYGDQVVTAGRTLIDLGGWAPGTVRRLLPAGLAIRVPARANIVMQVYLQPLAIDSSEDGRLAIYFSKPADRRAIVPIAVPPAYGIATGLSIPAGDPNYKFTQTFTLPIAVEAVGARAQANNLAREMTLTAATPPPKGTTRGLLNVSPWNPDWPESYFFATPVRLPAGSTLTTAIVFDNSTGNPHQLFSPPRATGWGRTPVGEMPGMTLLIAAPSDEDARVLRDAVAERLRNQLMNKRE